MTYNQTFLNTLKIHVVSLTVNFHAADIHTVAQFAKHHGYLHLSHHQYVVGQNSIGMLVCAGAGPKDKQGNCRKLVTD
jgi:hypothetical protein